MVRSRQAAFALILLAATWVSACNATHEPTLVPVSTPTITATSILTPTPVSTPTLPACNPVTITVIAQVTPQVTPCATGNDPGNYKLFGITCDLHECLFVESGEEDFPIGIATLKGYYSTIETSWFDNKKYVCDGFAIVGGSMAIYGFFRNDAHVNGKNEQAHALIMLDLETISKPDADLIKASSAGKPIDLLIYLPSPAHRGLSSPCETRYRIMQVNSTDPFLPPVDWR